MPSRVCPVNDIFIEWIYVVDLDLNVFRVSDTDNDNPLEPGTQGTQYFRLDNIPRHLFENQAMETTGYRYPVMCESHTTEYSLFDMGDVPAPDPILLASYEALTPPPTSTFSLPCGDRKSTWHKLQLQLLREFVQYFVYSFRDSCPSRTSSPFVFQQLAYAVLCLTSRAGMKFHRTTSEYVLHFDSIDPISRTPTWDPPDGDSYWLGDILIVLNQHVCTAANGDPSASTKASIALAVTLAPSTPTIAVIFSVHAIMLVNIVPGEPITHTVALPLFTLDPAAEPFGDEATASLEGVSYATPGVLALLDLFTAHPRVPCFAAVSGARIPTELCLMVFRFADQETQDAMEASCRMFRAIAEQYPRFAGRRVDKLGSGGWVEFAGTDEYGWEMGLWGREKVAVNMPVLKLQ